MKGIFVRVLSKILLKKIDGLVTPALDCEPIVSGSEGPILSIFSDDVYLERMAERFGVSDPLSKWFLKYFGLTNAIWRQKVYDSEPIRLTREDVVLDGGANMGIFTIYAALRVKEVVAVEPHETFLTYLKRNLECNKIENVRIIEGAIAEREGSLKLRVYDELGELPRTWDYNGELLYEKEVKGYTLDYLTEEFKPTIIKLALEGYEIEAMKGAGKSLDLVNKWMVSAFLERDGKPVWRHLKPIFENRGFEVEVKPIRDWRFIRRDILYAWR